MGLESSTYPHCRRVGLLRRVLHNMCLDWGLRKLRPGQNKDPDHELDIRVEAQKLFNKHNPHLNPDNLTQTEEVYQEDYGPTHLGLLCRRQYIYSQYGGPHPEYQLEPRPPGRGLGRGRGRGRGRGGGGVDTAGSSLNTSSRGGARVRGRGRGRGGGGVDTAGSTLNTSSRGGARGRGRGRGRGGGVDTAGSTLNTSSRRGARGCKRAAATQVVTPPPSKRRK